MKRDPQLEASVAAGMEESLPGDPAHAAGDDPRTAQFRRMAAGLRARRFEAPAYAIAAAKALMGPSERRTVWARLISGSLSLEGARAVQADSFQFVFERDEVRARMMYVRDAMGWEVTGQASAGWAPARKGRLIPSDSEGRFVFRVKHLRETELSLLSEALEIRIPSAVEAERNESGTTD